MSHWFSALRSSFLERGIRLPDPYPYTRRTLLGSALAALAAALLMLVLWLAWTIAGLSLWASQRATLLTIKTADEVSHAVTIFAEQKALELFPEMQARRESGESILPRNSHLGNDMRADIVEKTLPYSEGTPATLTDAVRQIDFSLLQTVLRLQLNTGQVQLLTSDFISRGQDTYHLQRMRIYLPPLAAQPSTNGTTVPVEKGPETEVTGPPEPIFRFANALAESLDVWADRAILSESPYKLTLGTKRTLTHEIWLETANPIFSFPAPNDPAPRMTLVLNGMGHDLKMAQDILGLKLPLTFAILPFAPKAEETAQAARLAGQELLLDLPMESMQSPYIKAGPDELKVSMDPQTLEHLIKKATEKLPYVTGATNFMGSRFTQDQTASRQLCAELAKSGLYVLDSMSSDASLFYTEARRRGLPAWRKTLTLDNGVLRSEAALLAQLKQAETQARQTGHVVVMVEPQPQTIAALKTWAKERDASIRMVPLRLQPIQEETLTPDDLAPLPPQTAPSEH